MKVTRISYSRRLTVSKYNRLLEIANRLGVLRSEVWNEFGSLKGVGLRDREIRDSWLRNQKKFSVPARLWKATLADVIGDITSYREAAKFHVRKAIRKRTKDEGKRKDLYTKLKYDKWIEDDFLRNKMRMFFKHGHTKARNQIILIPGSYKTFEFRGRVWLEVMSLKARKRISIPLNSSRKPTGTLRLILVDGEVEIHYATNVKDSCVTRPCGNKTLGVDKGYTEVLTDSEGNSYGDLFGKTLSEESDYLKKKYQRRNKLKAIANKKPHKAENIRKNNLGRKKLNKRRKKHKSNVRNLAYKATHALYDKASKVVSEDLTSPIKSKKKRSKNMKRRLSGWQKGLIAEALLNVSQRRGASLVLVNAAYTSQMDSRYGILKGKRKGDLFYCFDGVVLDADQNAALNVLARLKDREIGRWTSFKKVRSILLERTKLWGESNLPVVGTAQPRLQLQTSLKRRASTKSELSNNFLQV